jgi:hypothetical protein
MAARPVRPGLTWFGPTATLTASAMMATTAAVSAGNAGTTAASMTVLEAWRDCMRQKKKRRRRETELLTPVSLYFYQKGFHLQTEELQFYEYSIDLYGYDTNKNKTIAVELKIENWKRALEQTIIYQLCADLVWVAMPEETIQRVNQDLLEDEGIGLLSVGLNGECRVVVEPRKSEMARLSYKYNNVKFLKAKVKENGR